MQLVIDNLSKTYSNGTRALHNVSLTIGSGMFGLLGPNGAGKSTLMRIIATLQHADSGTVKLDGLDVLKNKEDIRQYLGYLPQEFGVYPSISAHSLLDYMAALKGIINKKQRKELVEALLQRVNLYEQRKKRVSSFSGGMRQRFGIAQALIGSPKLIIVDEPTAGLDPQERNRFYNLLSEIGETVIVILSTHIVEDVKELCRDMAIINKGEVCFKGSPGMALAMVKDKVFEKVIDKSELESYRKDYQVISNKLYEGRPKIHVFSPVPVPGFELVPADLEDVFFVKILGI